MTDNLNTPILVTGANGQVGGALVNLLYDNVVGLTREEFDLSRPDTLTAMMESINPSAIINAAAYTAVDKAEEEEALATVINGESVGVMARWCAAKHIPFVHYSTDYVFDGGGENFRTETDHVSPCNAYGRSKRAGEEAVEREGGDYLIFRTSWVYDATGKNFVNTMLRLGESRKELRVVGDQYGAPSYAPHLAVATVEALQKAQAMKAFPTGIYHMCNSGVTTWHGFAEAIFAAARQADVRLEVESVEAITTADFPTPAKRPHNSRLDMTKLESTFGITMPTWEEGLAECISAKFGDPVRHTADFVSRQNRSEI